MDQLGYTCEAAIASVKIATIEPSYIVTYINIGPLREDNSQFWTRSKCSRILIFSSSLTW